jgi:cytochrome c biogenesis protein
MRTALALLLALAVASVAGSFLPQIPNSPERVADYLRTHRFWGEYFLRAGFFDVFGSWWFGLITALLVISLVTCLVSRSRAGLRILGRRPIAAPDLERLKHHERRYVQSSPEQAIEASGHVLRRHRFRVERALDRAALAGEKGAIHEGGSLIFHWALVLLLVGVIFGKGTGYAGNAVIVEGGTWTNALVNYDGQIRTGRFFSGDFNGIGIHLVDYEDEFGPTGIPRYFRSTVDLLNPRGDVMRTEVIEVNHPVSVEGLRITQNGFGWAPKIEIRDGPNLLRSSEVPFSQGPPLDGVSKLAVPWHGFVKLLSESPPVAIEFHLWPDSRAFVSSLETGRSYAMLTEYRPLMTYTVWRGPLADPSNSSLDTDAMRKMETGVVGKGQTVTLLRGCLVDAGPPLEPSGGPCPGGAETELTLSFPELRNYSVLHVSRDPGVPIVLVAAILLFLGLLPALYTSRRRVWVQAEPHGDGAVMDLGGFAFQRRAQFEDEFSDLVEVVTSAAGGPLVAERPAVSAGQSGLDGP